MKPSVFLIFLLSISLPDTGYSQKRMKVDDDLKAMSEETRIRYKGISSLPRYYFGDYQVVEGKAGWITTDTKAKVFSNVSKSESKQKLSFVLKGPADSAMVNASIRGYYEEEQNWFFSEYATIEEDMQTYSGWISTHSDTSQWELVMVESINSGFRAAVKCGNKQYEIIPVMEYDNGKRPLGGLGLVLGYMIRDEEGALAAVQAVMYQAAWIRHDLPEEDQLRLAAVITSILVFRSASEG